jgi:hypothetical protein
MNVNMKSGMCKSNGVSKHEKYIKPMFTHEEHSKNWKNFILPIAENIYNKEKLTKGFNFLIQNFVILQKQSCVVLHFLRMFQAALVKHA